MNESERRLMNRRGFVILALGMFTVVAVSFFADTLPPTAPNMIMVIAFAMTGFGVGVVAATDKHPHKRRA